MGAQPDYVVEIVPPGGQPDFNVAVIGQYVVDISGATDGQVLTVQPDGSVAAEDPFDLDAMRFKGVINASTNPNYPAAAAGDLYRISVAGKIGGASGPNVEVGDVVFATAANAGGTQAAVGASWSIEQANIDGAVVGPASATSGNVPTFNGTTGKVIQDSGLSLDIDGTLAANSDAKLASQKATKTYADGKVVDSIADADTTHAPSRNAVFDALALKADLASPALTGNPTAPTPSANDNDTSIATTAFVTAAVAAGVVGLLDYRGTYNASVNTFPTAGGSGTAGAVLKGDFWVASVQGTLGGVVVRVGDLIIALTDAPGQTAGNWNLIEHDVGYAPEDVANKSVDGTFAVNSDTLYPSQKAAKTYVDAKVAAAVTYERVATGKARLDALTAQTTGLNESQANAPSGAAGHANVIYLDPADWPAGTTLRIRAIALVNDAAPATTFTFGLYPITTNGGAAANVTALFGTVVTGSTVAVTTPAANSQTVVTTGDFAAPAAGYYALGVVVAANMAANSSVGVRATLAAKHS